MIIKKIAGYFISGLAIALPVVATVWLIHYIVISVQTWFSVEYAYIGLAIALLSILLLGFLASSFLGEMFKKNVEGVIIKLPLLGLIYKALKDVTTAFVGKENRFSEPVLVKLTNEEVYKIGFVTNKNAFKLISNDEAASDLEELYAVYFPLSFSLSGDLFLVPKKRIKPVSRKGKDVMQAIVSGGIIKVD